MDQVKTGSFIAELRKQKNMTQSELAEAVFVSDKTISKWETGRSLPDTAYLSALCRTLGCTVNELLTGERVSESQLETQADENILSLMKENQIHRKSSVAQLVTGTILCILTILLILTNTTSGLQGVITFFTRFFDLPNIFAIILLSTAAVLLSPKKYSTATDNILHILDRTLVPTGGIITIINIILVLTNVTDLNYLGTNLAVSCMSMLYALCLKFIVIIILDNRG